MQDTIDVLIIEDNEDDAELMVLELEVAGYTVVWRRVETKDDFLTHLNTQVDIVLADYNLPQFTAPRALDLLLNYGFDTPFIVVTGSISEEIAVACIKQGAADYLLKDRLSRLGEAVRQAIKQRDLRRAQREAEQNLLIMNRAIDTSINAVVLADLSGRINYVNKAFHDLWGVEEDASLNGRSLSSLWASDQEADALLERVSNNSSLKGEMHTQSEDGREMVLQYSASMVKGGSGEPLCIMAIFIDITEQKEAEKSRQEAEILRIELEKERELRELKSRFVSMIVHDFRNPVSVIQLSLSILQKYFNRLEPDKLIEKIELMMQQTSHLNQLIDDVLMLGKMEMVATEFNPEILDLVVFCQEVFEEFQEGVDGTLYELDFIPHTASIYTTVDSTLMRRALVNLLSNAVKYSPEGGRIQMSVCQQGDTIELVISDEGIGISAEDQKRLFEGFHRGENVGRITGSGLGLTIVKQIVEVHSGEIICESELDTGTSFKLKLPLLSLRSLGE